MQKINRLAGVGCGGEDGSLVLLQDFEPASQIAGVVLANLRRNLQVGTEKRGTKFGNQFLNGVGVVAESFLAEVPIESRSVPRPVG